MSTMDERTRADADDFDRFTSDRGKDEHVGVTSETDASVRPIPPDAPDGLTSAAYSDVIRREADEGEITLDSGWLCEVHQSCTCGTGGEHGQHEPGCGLVPICKADDLLHSHERLRVENAALTDKVARFDRERQGFKAAIAQRDATIARMAADLLTKDDECGCTYCTQWRKEMGKP